VTIATALVGVQGDATSSAVASSFRENSKGSFRGRCGFHWGVRKHVKRFGEATLSCHDDSVIRLKRWPRPRSAQKFWPVSQMARPKNT